MNMTGWKQRLADRAQAKRERKRGGTTARFTLWLAGRARFAELRAKMDRGAMNASTKPHRRMRGEYVTAGKRHTRRQEERRQRRIHHAGKDRAKRRIEAKLPPRTSGRRK